MNAPFSWPNSSLSSSVSGMAAQFTATKGPRTRSLSSWITRASSSLPVPLSPWMSTVAVERDTWRATLSAARSRTLSPRNEADAGRGAVPRRAAVPEPRGEMK